MSTSRKDRHILFGRMISCSMVLASLLAFLAFTPAYAATSGAVTPAVSCNASGAELIYQENQTHGNETRHIQLWYSTGTRCVWAAETNGQPGDEIWVYNENTGNEADWTLTANSGLTAKIDDAGTQSQACMLPHYINGVYNGPPICTPFF